MRRRSFAATRSAAFGAAAAARPRAFAALWLGLALGLGPLPAGAQAAGARHDEGATDPAGLAPRYLLKDPRGRVVSHESFRGRFQLVAFGFTSCPDVCPTTLLAVKNILEALGTRAARLQPLFVTVDPERDTPQLLAEYTAAFHPAIVGLTGSPELIRRAADSFRVGYEKVREPGAAEGTYTMSHSTGLYLLDGEGRFVTRFAAVAPPAEIATRIGQAMDADRTPEPRGRAPLR